jgi:hypothetical protein
MQKKTGFSLFLPHKCKKKPFFRCFFFRCFLVLKKKLIIEQYFTPIQPTIRNHFMFITLENNPNYLPSVLK